MAGLVDENIFKCWCTNGNCTDFSRERLDDLRDELMSFRLFYAYGIIQHTGLKSELFLQQTLKLFRIFCYNRNYFSANLAFQFLRRSKGNQSPLIKNRKPVAVFSFFEDMGCDDN